MIQVPVELLILLLAAFAVYTFIMVRIAKSTSQNKTGHADAADAPQAFAAQQPLLFEQPQEKTPIPVTIVNSKEHRRTERLKLDALLAELVSQNINSLNVATQIALTNKGEYRILGKTWNGEVSLTIKPKAEEKTVEKTREEKEEPLF